MKQSQKKLFRKQSRSLSNVPKKHPTPIPSLHQGQVLAGRFRLQEKLGQGSFGSIFKTINIDNSEVCATKFEKRDHRNDVSLLMREIKVLTDIGVMKGFPQIYFYGRDEHYNYFMATYLGNNLEQLIRKCGGKFSTNTIIRLAIQMLDRIEAFHQKNLIHRDIKPENYVIGNEDITLLYMIDFGLAKYYRDHNDGKHIPNVEKKGLIGTARYASINAHQGREQSRKDDLFSIGYVLVYLSTGKLPWMNITADKKQDKYRKIMEKKMSISYEELCCNLPKAILQYFHIISQLQFTETPNYQKLKQLFEYDLANQILNGEKSNSRLDWEKLAEYRKNRKESYEDSVHKSQEKERSVSPTAAIKKSQKMYQTDKINQKSSLLQLPPAVYQSRDGDQGELSNKKNSKQSFHSKKSQSKKSHDSKTFKSSKLNNYITSNNQMDLEQTFEEEVAAEIIIKAKLKEIILKEDIQFLKRKNSKSFTSQNQQQFTLIREAYKKNNELQEFDDIAIDEESPNLQLQGRNFKTNFKH